MVHVRADVGVTPQNTYSIAGKQLKLDSAVDISPYVQELEARSSVLKIDISGNTFGIGASEAFAQAVLKHKDTLVEVNFSDIYTGRLNTEIPQSLDHLLPALLKCPYLQIVDLCDNAFGLQTIEPIESYISKAVSVQHLILSNNGMGPFAGTRIGKSLFKLSLAKKKTNYPSLKTFICGRNRLENGSVNYLSIGLRNHSDLETVRLYQNGIRPAGVEKLIQQGLSRNKKLQVIDLQDNTLTTRAATALAEALQSWPDLVELNLADCLLKPKGSLILADHLANGESKKRFTTLKLQYNELEGDALKRLVRFVSEKAPVLEVLELNGNRFEEDSEDIKAITETFELRGLGELDELDELEELDSDEEDEDDEDEDDTFEDANAELDQLETELAGISPEEVDTSVDAVANALAGTHLK